jgi:hypothetical protein
MANTSISLSFNEKLMRIYGYYINSLLVRFACGVVVAMSEVLNVLKSCVRILGKFNSGFNISSSAQTKHNLATDISGFNTSK